VNALLERDRPSAAPDPSEGRREEYSALAAFDPELVEIIRREDRRQRDALDLIASENVVRRAVREAAATRLTDKCAEGTPGKRGVPGCEEVDEIERLAIDRARVLFGAEHANVQPYSGSLANLAVYLTALNPGDVLLAMDPGAGGRPMHGAPGALASRLFRIVSYGVETETERIDYDQVQRLAEEHKPKLLVAGVSAYTRLIDFKRMRDIADSVGAMLMADIAHLAGLVAAGGHPSPVPVCEFVTASTQMTLGGPRGGLILCQSRYADEIDRQVFPGLQGGPLMHGIAAKAVCFLDALRPAFQDRMQRTVVNARALAAGLENRGLRLVTGGTDNHMVLADIRPAGRTGKEAVSALERAGILVNKLALPAGEETGGPGAALRLGTPAATTRGLGVEDMATAADWIADVLAAPSPKTLQRVRAAVAERMRRAPLDAGEGEGGS
jgi:glycine hydroxymethyltransferase